MVTQEMVGNLRRMKLPFRNFLSSAGWAPVRKACATLTLPVPTTMRLARVLGAKGQSAAEAES